MNTNFSLYIYGLIAGSGVIWPFYFLSRFIQNMKFENISNPVEIANIFVSGVWANESASFIASDLTLVLIGIFLFMFHEGRKLKMKVWWIYYPLTFIISFAFSFGLFMFMREKSIQNISKNE